MGSKAASGKGQAGAQWAGKGKEWKKEDAERLSHLLVIEDVFAEEVRTGYKNSQAVYISVCYFLFAFIRSSFPSS